MTPLKNHIIDYISTFNRTTLQELADTFHTSEMHIHTQIIRMQTEGYPIKLRKGVVSLTWKERFKRWVS